MKIRNSQQQRGAILVAVTWLLIALVAVAIIFGSRMAVENVAAANHVAQLQADAIELGAEQFVTEQISTNSAEAYAISTIDSSQFNARQLGDGYFWIIRPSPDNASQYDYGISDEGGKININAAGSDVLSALPNSTTDIASAITTWRSPTGPTSTNGFGDSYYLTLSNPYHCKGADFESVEELLLVKGITSDLLFNKDTNHNGTLESWEQATTNNGSSNITVDFNQDDGRGWESWLTAYSITPNTTSSGGTRVQINPPMNPALANLIQQNFSSRAQSILEKIRPYGNFTNVFDFYVKAGLTTDEFTKIIDKITVTPARSTAGLINVNTAPKQVLRCLPSLDENDVATLISKRASNTTTGSIAWVASALNNTKAVAIGGLITGRSYQYSADIVAVSGNGRGFKRVRVVWDVQKTPYVMVYRKDLTHLGWPLDPSIRDNLRAGRTPSDSAGSKGGS